MEKLSKMRSTILTILAVGLATVSLAGGPWTHDKGKGYVKVAEWWVVFDEHFTDVGKLDPNVTTGIYNTFLYAEYGFSDRLTGVFNGALFSRNYMNNLVSRTTGEVLVPGESVNTLGDIDITAKYSLTKKGAKWPVAASLTLGLPTGTDAAGSQLNLQTGDGEFNQMLRIDAGKGFNIAKKTSAYVASFAAVNNRTNEFSEEFRYGLEFGAGLANSKLWLITRLTGIESFKNGPDSGMLTSTSIFANNTEFTSLGIEAAYYATSKIGFSAGVAGAFRGEIIAAAPSYSVGIFYDFSK